MSDITTNSTSACEGCFKISPAVGLLRPLPVHRQQRGGPKVTVLLCLKCRRNEFAIRPEPYQRGIEAYLDEATGATILPRLSEDEARLEYCLDYDQLELLPHVTVRSVKSVHPPYKTNLYEEKVVLDKARSLYGGDIGITNAREVLFNQREGFVDASPSGHFRDRVNKIRQAFMEKGVYASSMMPVVENYMKYNQGNLQDIVKTHAV